MIISFVFNEDDTNSEDPNGDILISDGRSTISERSAYLDSWFDALIAGLKQVESGRSASVDLVEEPYPLVFEPKNGGLNLTYKNTTVSLDSVNEFRRALENATDDFLQNFKVDRSAFLDAIRGFSKHG